MVALSPLMNIQAFLEAEKLSQKAFADRLGVTQGRISQWICGEEVPLDRIQDIERETGGRVTRFDLRPDFPWERVAVAVDMPERAA